MPEHDQKDNADYRKMYYTLAAEVENAISLLIRAQQKCEDILLDSLETDENLQAD